jgi:phosphatidylglycerophosphate synthase
MSGAAAGFALLTESFAVAALLLQVMVVLDFADGMVARRTSTSTYFGFVYDFVGDRLKIAWFLSCVSAVTPGVLALAWVALLLLVLSDGLSVGLLPRSSGRTPVRSFHGVRAVARIVAANLVRFDMHIIGLAGVFLLLGARGGQITLVILVGSLALNLGRVVAGRWEWDPLGGRHGFHPRSGIWQKFWNRLR